MTREIDRSFYGGVDCYHEDAQKICFRQVFADSMSGVNAKFSTWTQNRGFAWKCEAARSMVVPIVESTHTRARCAKSHAIWCTEARERAIFGFHGASVWCVAADAHMQRPSLRVLSRGDIRLTVCRGPEVCFRGKELRSRSAWYTRVCRLRMRACN